MTITTTNEIILAPGATAEPDTCGSCKFFGRKPPNEGEWYRMNGFCRFLMPAKIALQSDLRGIDPKHKDDEYTGNENMIKDTDRCDLQKPDGKTYIVQRRISP